MKLVKIVLCLLLCLQLSVGVVTSAMAQDGAAAPSVEIKDVFSDAIFSDASVNEILKRFPGIQGGIDAEFGMDTVDLSYITDSFPMGADGSVMLYRNGAHETETTAAFFSQLGINVYPETLGAYLKANGYEAIGSAIAAAGNWDAFLENNDNAFAFDWGIDAIDDPTTKYNAFIGAVGTLFDAALPIFKAALGSEDQVLTFAGSNAFYVDGNIRLLGTTFTFNMKPTHGKLTLTSANQYQNLLIPAYRALGINSLCPYTFSNTAAATTGTAMAKLVYDPIQALVSTVQSEPDACEALIRFYQTSGIDLRRAIPAATSCVIEMELQFTELNLESGSSLISSTLNLIEGMLKQALATNVAMEIVTFDHENGLRGRLDELLPTLTYTAPEPEPEPTDEPGEEDEPETEGNSLLDFLRRIADWLRNLINWIKSIFGIG